MARIIYDLLRVNRFLYNEQQINSQSLRGLLARFSCSAQVCSFSRKRYLIKNSPGLIRKSPSQIWAENYFKSFGTPKKYILNELKSHACIKRRDVVFGWETPPYLKSLLTEQGVSYIDFRLSPLRFLTDYGIDISTNCQRHAELFEQCAEFLENSHELQKFKHETASRRPFEKSRLVIIEQTPMDASIISREGSFKHIFDYADTIREISKSFDEIIFRKHPKNKTENWTAIKKQFPAAELDTSDQAYELFRPNAVFCAVSSSVLHEAEAVGLKAIRLMKEDALFSKDEYTFRNLQYMPTLAKYFERKDKKKPFLRALFN